MSFLDRHPELRGRMHLVSIPSGKEPSWVKQAYADKHRGDRLLMAKSTASRLRLDPMQENETQDAFIERVRDAAARQVWP